MAIYERTKEIGIMKVIGAGLSDIRNMFLIESATIGLVGGAVGLLFSYLISFIMNHFLSAGALSGIFGGAGEGNISVIPVYLALGALVFATLVGLIAGYMPARRAMKLSVIDAIRKD